MNALGVSMLSREEALNLIKSWISKRNVILHMLAVEAIMRNVARYLGEDEEVWGLAGLLHDIDYEETEEKPDKHGLLAEEILKGHVSDEIINAIKAHNFKYTGVKPQSLLDKALIACDAVSGLLVACALVMPSKKLEEVKVETVIKKFKDKDFARGADRERILLCEAINIPKEKFFGLALQGLKNIAQDIGL